MCIRDSDAPLAALDPAPARGAGVELGQFEGVFRGRRVEVFVGPGGALVGEEGVGPADAEPAALVLVDHEGEAHAG